MPSRPRVDRCRRSCRERLPQPDDHVVVEDAADLAHAGPPCRQGGPHACERVELPRQVTPAEDDGDGGPHGKQREALIAVDVYLGDRPDTAGLATHEPEQAERAVHRPWPEPLLP